MLMSNSDPSPPPPHEPPSSGDRPPGLDGPGGGKRGEQKPSSNLFWFLMIFGAIALIVFSVFNQNRSGEELAFSEFVMELERRDANDKGEMVGRFHKNNVFELVIGTDYIKFQDKPKVKNKPDNPATKFFQVPFVKPSEGDLKRLTEALEAQKIVYGYAGPPSEWQAVLIFLLPIVFLLFLFLLLFRRVGGAGSAMSFGRSRARLYAQEEIDSSFQQVAGIDEAVEELREVVEFLRNPGKYQALGGRIPRGVLLVGPPGTGKTLLAKAVAGEAGVPFYSLSGSDFVEMFVGVGAARVRDMFQQAATRSPAIIFIDELDALGKVRGSGMPGGHDEREQTLNALLVEMDGFSTEQSVIVMGATNRPETLDPALLRPGRFDRHVLVDRPDIKGREAILKVHAGKIKMDDSVDLGRLAKITPGFVGADLANLVNEAALLAARGDKKRVTMEEFEEGVERVIAGLEKQTRIIHEEEKLRVAYHECGHALVACVLPNTDPVHKISIIPRGYGALGYTMHRPNDEKQLVMQSELENQICCLLGGIIAEEIVYQETSTGAQNDLQRATDIARRMVTDFGMSRKMGRVFYGEKNVGPTFLGPQAFRNETVHSAETIREIETEVKRIVDEAAVTVRDVLGARRELLDHLASELVEVEVMDSDHLKQILDEHTTGPQIKPGTFVAPSVVDETEPEPEFGTGTDDEPGEASGA
ncbi:MAG: cell division protein FtsH [Planctomycetaceae bacterium]|nr:cell division protein FtsH [Planctomycetaceae bacterium]|tara:strand:- start:2717 stop:4819 length:2103 start_codon:yes stop_codon:yes gene_type:complete